MQKPILEQTKKCTKCGEVKVSDMFYRWSISSDGLCDWCKECKKVADKSYKEKNRATLKQKSRVYCRTEEAKKLSRERLKRFYSTPHGIDSRIEKNISYRANFPEKYRAVTALHNAVSNGKITKPSSCSLCGKKGMIHGHHWSYEEKHFLDVVWLCPQCHSETHEKERAVRHRMIGGAK